ncbi:MAG: nucleotide exchange factor GrpE [Candidatus Eisenbacteria bacterium]|nr:nucleotide exchange factor GrpE [Candidatus Eisenbacteria bacterium]
MGQGRYGREAIQALGRSGGCSVSAKKSGRTRRSDAADPHSRKSEQPDATVKAPVEEEIAPEADGPEPEASAERASRAQSGPPQAEGSTETPSAETATEPSVPLEQHQRLLAEFDNYRKRTDRERGRTAALAAGDLALQLLPVLDDFERAEAARPDGAEAYDREGILIIRKRLAEALKREGLRQIEASPGDRFDPEIHEAVLTVPSDEYAEGQLAEVLQTGYLFGDRLLRASRVVVSSGPASKPAETGAED